jgi:Winged helix DNA-binding domain
MVQVPTQTTWSYPGNPKFTLAETWLDTRLPTAECAPELVRRYLAAFGPATVKDMETWSYLPNQAPVFERLRPELVTYRDERGRELFDLPELPIVAGEATTPLRFLPEFDNLLLAHQDRARLVPTAYRKSVYLPGVRVAATVLIDGFVAATWTSERIKRTATVRVTPFTPLSKAVTAEISQEAERLGHFLEPDAHNVVVRVGQ